VDGGKGIGKGGVLLAIPGGGCPAYGGRRRPGVQPGITISLSTGGDLKKAKMLAAHKIARTTTLYNRRSDVVSLDEVEKVVF
jgi:hypothetical protein